LDHMIAHHPRLHPTREGDVHHPHGRLKPNCGARWVGLGFGPTNARVCVDDDLLRSHQGLRRHHHRWLLAVSSEPSIEQSSPQPKCQKIRNPE
jgi:hypothetical protein